MEEDWIYLKETVIRIVEEVAEIKVKYRTEKSAQRGRTEGVTKKMKAFRNWMKTRQPEDRE